MINLSLITPEMAYDAASEAGVEIRSYQGRGMTDECVGLDYDSEQDVRNFIRAIIDCLGTLGVVDDDELDEAYDDIIERTSYDQMGRRGIAYWRAIKLPYNPDQDNNDEDVD